jgi:hypothetical protein
LPRLRSCSHGPIYPVRNPKEIIMTFAFEAITNAVEIDTRGAPVKIVYAPRRTLVSEHPWFLPRPLVCHAYDVYQVATVITTESPEYPSYGTREEKDAWRVAYEEIGRKADELAQLQAPGCRLLRDDVFGRTYVYDGLDTAGIHDVAVLLNTPPQVITEETWQYMLEVLPPQNWSRSGSVERFSMSEFQSGPVTSAFFRMPRPVGLHMHRYVVPDRDLACQVVPAIESMMFYVEAKGCLMKWGDTLRAAVRKCKDLSAAIDRAQLAHRGLWAFERGGSFEVDTIHDFILNNKVTA